MYLQLGRAEPITRVPGETPGAVTAMALNRVFDTTTGEFRAICRVVAKTSNGHAVGTGVLIGPRHVLTCAHVIFPPENPDTRRITVFPAQNGPGVGKGIASNGWIVEPSWNVRHCATWDRDFGVIRLDEPVTSGFWSVGDFSPAAIVGKRAQMAGYPTRPTDREAQFMLRSAGAIIGSIQIDACTPTVLRRTLLRPITNATRLVAHRLDSAKSMSGSPMWTYIDNQRVMWGIHAGDIDNGARKKAILLNDRVRATIARWMQHDLPWPLRRV